MRRAKDRLDEQADDAPREAAPLRVSEPTVLALQRTAGNAATSRALEGFERSFGTDFSSVRVHPDSPRAGGDVHAVTQGEDIHVAPGRLAPGSPAGDRLIAHELAHVVQQRSGGSPAPGLMAEADADRAAASAVAGGPARPAVAAPAGAPQAYEAWEHRDLGDAMGGADRKVTLPNGITLTYGQMVALSGDFYRSPEALMHADHDELQHILDVMEKERSSIDPATHRPAPDAANDINADYEMATTGGTRGGPNGPAFGGDADTLDPTAAHGAVVDGEHVESGAPGADKGFFDLADANAAHFSPDNIKFNWRPKHQLALDLAKQAWEAKGGTAAAPMSSGTAPSAREGTLQPGSGPVTPDHPDPAATSTTPGTAVTGNGAAADREAEAWMAAGFSDHFLTDSFASGHLISGDVGRKVCEKFYEDNKSAIAQACFECLVAEGGIVDPVASAEIVTALQAFLESQGKVPSLLLKTVHDYYNREGALVRNALGTIWHTVGDASLGSSPETIQQASLASKASRDAVEDVLRTGTTARAEAALDYIPDLAMLPEGSFVPIEQFSENPTVWDPVLRRAKTGDPEVNGLYQLVKGNLRPIVTLLGRKGMREASGLAGRAWEGIKDGAHAAGELVEEGAHEVGQAADDILSWPGRLEREIERLYSPY